MTTYWRDPIEDIVERYGKKRVSDIMEAPLDNDVSGDGRAEHKDIDALIVCALAEERDQMFNAFGVSQETRNRDFNDYRGDFGFRYKRFSYGKLEFAVVTQGAMGMAHASSLVTRATLALKPRIVAMTGICAGRKDSTKLGDVIVASQAFDYTAGKYYTKFFAPRPEPIPLDNDAKDFLVNDIINNNKFCGEIVGEWNGNRVERLIKVHLKSMASGTSVIDDKTTMKKAAGHQDSLYGIDMEAYGVALAASNVNVRWIVAKGVQDYADGEKEATEGDYREFASYASACVVRQVLVGLLCN